MFAHELQGTQIFIAQAGECEYKMSIWTVMHWLQQVYSKSECSMGDYTGKFFSSAVVPDSFNAQKALSLYRVLSASPFCSIPFLSLSCNSPQALWAWTKTQGNLKNKKIITGWPLIIFLSLQQPIDVNKHLWSHIFETTVFQACCGITGMYRMYIFFLFQKFSRPGHFIFGFI